MGLTVDEVRGVRRVALSGRLDADGLAEVEEDFAAAVGEGPDVIVDLAEVPFLASMGIRMLVTASKQQEQLGGTMVMVGLDEMTARVVRTMGIDQLIPVRDTADDAVELF